MRVFPKIRRWRRIRKNWVFCVVLFHKLYYYVEKKYILVLPFVIKFQKK